MHLITNQKKRKNFRGFESYFFRLGGLPKWPTGADCKSAGNAFAGSNPASTTKLLPHKTLHKARAATFDVNSLVSMV